MSKKSSNFVPDFNRVYTYTRKIVPLAILCITCAEFALPKKYGRRGGHTQEVEATIYNLDVIISVGYRVKSQRGTPFRQGLRQEVVSHYEDGLGSGDSIKGSEIKVR